MGAMLAAFSPLFVLRLLLLLLSSPGLGGLSPRSRERGLRRVCGLICALVLGACDGSSAPDNSMVEDASPIGRRFWSAGNEQARAVTGNLAVSVERGGDESALVLAFANGVTVRASLKESRAASTLVGGSTFLTLADLLGVPADAEVWLYQVQEERVAPSAAQGGLCAGVRTRTLAIVEFVDDANAWALRIASFHGDLTQSGEPGLCFSYDYVQA